MPARSGRALASAHFFFLDLDLRSIAIRPKSATMAATIAVTVSDMSFEQLNMPPLQSLSPPWAGTAGAGGGVAGAAASGMITARLLTPFGTVTLMTR